MKTVHKICTYLQRYSFHNQDKGREAHSAPCAECPATKKIAGIGTGKSYKGTQMCRLAAEEVLNIVKTGNPWGKKNCKWP